MLIILYRHARLLAFEREGTKKRPTVSARLAADLLAVSEAIQSAGVWPRRFLVHADPPTTLARARGLGLPQAQIARRKYNIAAVWPRSGRGARPRRTPRILEECFQGEPRLAAIADALGLANRELWI